MARRAALSKNPNQLELLGGGTSNHLPERSARRWREEGYRVVQVPVWSGVIVEHCLERGESQTRIAQEDEGTSCIRRVMAERQREISVSEFFTKNRHLLGFDNPAKALLTTIKEAVDNSLDACEEAGILSCDQGDDPGAWRRSI